MEENTAGRVFKMILKIAFWVAVVVFVFPLVLVVMVALHEGKRR